MANQILIHKTSLIKQFLLLFLPFVFIIVLLSWVIYYFQFIKTQEEVLKAKELNSLAMQKELIQQTIQSIVSDINIIAANDALQDILVHKSQDATSHVTAEFFNFSIYKEVYDQIRVLDKTGMEIIRVDLRGKEPFPVPFDQLQFKGKRYYFKDTYRLSKGEIFMSPMDLNIENGKIEKPYKPMIRFGTPIFDKNNVKQGVLILNYLGKKLIDDLLKLSLDSPGHLMMLNADGYWLKGMDPETEWGFMFEDRYEEKIQNQYPRVWQKIKENETGQIFSKKGLITFVKVFPLKEGINSSTGSAKPFQESVADLNPDQFFWAILSHVMPDKLHKENNSFVFVLFVTDLFLIILMGVLSWQLVLAKTRRRLAEDALKKSNLDLEEKVKKRTKELFITNEALKEEIKEHEQVISEKQKMESQLRQAQKMEAIGTLAGGIAHDFNNILTPIIGYAEMAIMQLDQKDPLLDDMNEILSASHRAKELVQQILTFSRQTEHEMRPIKVQLIIEEVVRLLKAAIPTTIEIRLDIKSDCNPVMVDHTQIHQVIMNLCTNAYHSMYENGGVLGIILSQIEIGPEDYQTNFEVKAGTYIKLEVSDSGHGMSKELQEKIFEPYFTTKEEGDGTGLGLSVVHGIIKSLNGYIAVYSEPEIGSTFYVYLPIVKSQVEHPESVSKENIPTGTENILVVDDEASIMKFEKKMLESLGYSVTGRTSSREALKIFGEDPEAFDLVITDMTMPKMNGVDLIKNLIKYRSNIPTILCTGFSATIDPETAKDLGVSSYITKPIILMELAKAIRSALNKNKS